MLREILLSYLRQGKDPFPDIIGQKEAKEQLISSLLAGRHVIIVGPPGIGKTTLAKSVAKLLPKIKVPRGVPYWMDPIFPFVPEEIKKKWETGPFEEIPGIKRFVRVQGSPDLTVEDLIGDIDPMKALKYGILSPQAFIPGKIFRAHKGVLFFDEINRAPPKVQNALLQVLEEGTVTIGSFEIEIPVDFILIATMNPEDFAGTERLSDVLLDRFDIIYMTYPSLEEEIQIVKTKGKNLGVEFPESLLYLVVKFIQELREDEKLEKKPSVRATLGIYEKAQAFALMNNRKKVELKDIEKALLSVLPHRIRLKPSYRFETDIKEYIKKKWELFLSSEKGSDVNFNENKKENFKEEGKVFPTEKGFGSEGFYRKETEIDKKEGKILEEALNKGILNLQPDDIFRNITSNPEEAEKMYGKKFLEYFTSYDYEFVKRNVKIPEFQREIYKNIVDRIRSLRKKKLLDKNFNINFEKIDKVALKILEEEILKLRGLIYHGIYESDLISAYGEYIDTRKYTIGDRYLDINPRETIRKYIRKRDIIKSLTVNIKNKLASTKFLILLDVSGSMKGKKISDAKKATIAFSYKSIMDGNPVGLIAFNDKIVSKIHPCYDFFLISREALKLIPLGLTDIALALEEASKILDKGHIILITDSVPTVGEDPVKETIEAAKRIRNKGLTLSVIGIDLDPEAEKTAKILSEIGNGKLYLIKDTEHLDYIVLMDYFLFKRS